MKKLLLALCCMLLAAPVFCGQTVRVLLGENLKTAQIKTSALVHVYALGQGKKYKISKPQTLSVQLGGGKLHLGQLQTADPLVIEPAAGTQLTFQKNAYTGKFYAVPNGKTFQLIEYTDMEDYLLGVLPYEMSYSWPLEALKAQAVAARTFTLMQLQARQKNKFDLYSDVRSQMYKGSGKVYDSVQKAVSGTKGQVLRYQGNLFNTYYHANCGGGTDNVQIWAGPKAAAVKPLSGTSCAYDKHSKSYSWNATVPTASVNQFVNKNGLAGSVKKIKVAKRTATRRAETLEFTTHKGKKTLSCAKFRLGVGAALLKSCKITEISKTGKGFAFAGHGFGHGIGMCQDGAKGMAQAGKNYKQILSYYFPNSKLTDD